MLFFTLETCVTLLNSNYKLECSLNKYIPFLITHIFPFFVTNGSRCSLMTMSVPPFVVNLKHI